MCIRYSLRSNGQPRCVNTRTALTTRRKERDRMAKIKYPATHLPANTSLSERLAHYSLRNPMTGCDEWQASRMNSGYGQTWTIVNGRRTMTGAHRVSWEHHFGPIPGGLFVLHKCDNKICIRPDHLFLGTQMDNTKDKIKKGRHLHGQKIWNAILSEDDVRAIRAAPVHYGSGVALARRYGISLSAISSIRNRRRWTYVT